MTKLKKNFTEKLMKWHAHENHRSLPWKNENNPYKIWLSEIILQQTRAEQGLNYYLKFTEHYPTICDLANAADDEVFRHWQGLGYYNRCKNMLATARYICAELKGVFPDKYENILALKGVGAYTAAAISSFAFGLAYAVVDGNVYRVLSRYFGIEEAIDSSSGKAYFASLASELLDKKKPAAYNQAIMDLGATVCSPKNPQCAICPINKSCVAFRDDLFAILPFKEKKLKVSKRYFNFLLLQYEDKVWIQRRREKGIWENLHQFFLIETEESIDAKALQLHPLYVPFKSVGSNLKLEIVIKQRLTHQLIESKVYSIHLEAILNTLPKNGIWVPVDQLNKYAFPKTLVSFFDQVFK